METRQLSVCRYDALSSLGASRACGSCTAVISHRLCHAFDADAEPGFCPVSVLEFFLFLVSALSLTRKAGLLYLLTSVGYLATDVASAHAVDPNATWFLIVYMVLALLLVFDAILYFVEWNFYRGDNKRIDESVWANVLNVFGSLVYVLSAWLYFYFPPIGRGEHGELSRAHAAIQSSLSLIASVVFLIDALLYNSAWFNEYRTDEATRGNRWFTWGELLNTLPSLAYVGTVSFALFAQLSPGYNATRHAEVTYWTRILYGVWDAMYLIDAACYLLAWHHDWSAEQMHAYGPTLTDDPQSMQPILNAKNASLNSSASDYKEDFD